jgi:cathepsin L
MDVPVGNETALKDAVFKMPVMALIDASHASFQLYRSGIYSEPLCKSTQLDHAVQVVGYGSMNGRDYWICKNSWGLFTFITLFWKWLIMYFKSLVF